MPSTPAAFSLLVAIATMSIGCGTGTSSRSKVRDDALTDAGTSCLPRLQCPAGQVCADMTGYLDRPAADSVCVWGRTPCDAVTCESGSTCINLEKAPPAPHCE